MVSWSNLPEQAGLYEREHYEGAMRPEPMRDARLNPDLEPPRSQLRLRPANSSRPMRSRWTVRLLSACEAIPWLAWNFAIPQMFSDLSHIQHLRNLGALASSSLP